MNGEIGTEVTQCPEKEYINGIFVAVHNRLPLSGTYETATALAYTLLKKIKFSSYLRKFRVEQLQSHI
jgi:hypothetical protein